MEIICYILYLIIMECKRGYPAALNIIIYLFKQECFCYFRINKPASPKRRRSLSRSRSRGRRRYRSFSHGSRGSSSSSYSSRSAGQLDFLYVVSLRYIQNIYFFSLYSTFSPFVFTVNRNIWLSPNFFFRTSRCKIRF